MYCLYQWPINPKTGVLGWNGSYWAAFLCNGVNCRRSYYPDEVKAIKNVYCKNNGKEIPEYIQKE